MRKIDQSAKLSAGIYAGIFLLMFVFNRMTLYLFDDFLYLYSFADKTRITSIAQIFPSMAAHIQTMNGRTMAHFLVQLFMLLPMWVFDLVNAGMFLLLIWGICALAGMERKRSNLLTATVFCAIWVYAPAFGQVVLWQDGATSYLWASSLGLVLLYLTAQDCLYDRGIKSPWGKMGFLALSFLTGGYLEPTSAGVLVAMTLLVGVGLFIRRKKIGGYIWAGLALAALGFLSMFLSPAEFRNKAGDALTRVMLMKQIIFTTEFLKNYSVPLLVFVGSLVICILAKTDLRQILLGVILFIGALAANYIHIFAYYYPPRSAMGMVSLLLCADAVLLRAILDDHKYLATAAVTAAIMIVSFVPEFFVGFQDIALTYVRMRNNERAIHQCADEGREVAEIKDLSPESKYSPGYGLIYVQTDPDKWPNTDMARYYGVEAIVGIPSSPKETAEE